MMKQIQEYAMLLLKVIYFQTLSYIAVLIFLWYIIEVSFK